MMARREKLTSISISGLMLEENLPNWLRNSLVHSMAPMSVL